MGPEILVGLVGAGVLLWLLARARRSASADRQAPPARSGPAPLRPDQLTAEQLTQRIEREAREALRAQKSEAHRVKIEKREARRAEQARRAEIDLEVEARLRALTEEDEEDYRQFVDRVWNAPGAIAADVPLQRVDHLGVTVKSRVQSIVPREGGGLYVNVIESGERKTYVADRHRWLRDGRKVSGAAFRAVVERGIPPEEALRHIPAPTSIAAALAPENNHIQANHSLVIGYRAKDGPGFLPRRERRSARR